MLLHGTLTLHEIADVERFVTAIVHRSPLDLSHHDREDAITYLVETAWELSLSYQPGGVSFSTLAGTTLRHRLIDWQRARLGRTRWQFKDRVYERPRVELVSLDSDDPDRNPLGDTLGSWAGDPAADRSPDLARLLGGRDSAEVWEAEALGLRPRRRAP